MEANEVNHPKHYQGKIEVIEFLEDQFMNRPHEWNAVKYLARAGRKDPAKEIQDLEKAVWYIKRKIELLHAEKFDHEPRRPNGMNRKDKDEKMDIDAYMHAMGRRDGRPDPLPVSGSARPKPDTGSGRPPGRPE